MIGELLPDTIKSGHSEIADYLVAINSDISQITSLDLDYAICADKRLDILKWIHEHPLIVEMPCKASEIYRAVKTGNLTALKWYNEFIIGVMPSPAFREVALTRGHNEVYQWLLGRYFTWGPRVGLTEDLQFALDTGNLEVAKMIFESDRLQDGKKFTINRSVNR
jgi:hypothetical protein